MPGPKAVKIRFGHVARLIVGIALALLALYAVYGKSGELSAASSYLRRLDWSWFLMAGVVEFASVVAFAAMLKVLCRAGGTSVGLSRLVPITFAGNSITNSLPAGPAWASYFAFRQLRRNGADSTLAGWALVAMVFCSSLTLAVLCATGLAVARIAGKDTFGTATTIGIVVLVSPLLWVVLGTILHRRRRLESVVAWIYTKVGKLTRRPGSFSAEDASIFVSRLEAVVPSKAMASKALFWSLVNWVLDIGCLCFAFEAVKVPIPWSGLLLAYGAGQLAANLPITPGGLGVVEGSLEIALVAFGSGRASSVAAILIYRILSFWILLPVGWAAWAAIALKERAESKRPLNSAGAHAPSQAPEASI